MLIYIHMLEKVIDKLFNRQNIIHIYMCYENNYSYLRHRKKESADFYQHLTHRKVLKRLQEGTNEAIVSSLIDRGVNLQESYF